MLGIRFLQLTYNVGRRQLEIPVALPSHGLGDEGTRLRKQFAKRIQRALLQKLGVGRLQGQRESLGAGGIQPVPIDDVEGRIRQARQIAQLRDEGPVAPFSMDEIAEMRRELSADAERGKQASLPRLAALPADMLAAVHARLSGGNGQPPPGSDNSIGLTSLPLDEANDSQLTEAGKRKSHPNCR